MDVGDQTHSALNGNCAQKASVICWRVVSRLKLITYNGRVYLPQPMFLCCVVRSARPEPLFSYRTSQNSILQQETNTCTLRTLQGTSTTTKGPFMNMTLITSMTIKIKFFTESLLLEKSVLLTQIVINKFVI